MKETKKIFVKLLYEEILYFKTKKVLISHYRCSTALSLIFVFIHSQISSPGVDVGLVGQCCPLLGKLTVTEDPSRTVTLPNSETPLYGKLQELKVNINYKETIIFPLNFLAFIKSWLTCLHCRWYV
jgi:hypothetical protein